MPAASRPRVAKLVVQSWVLALARVLTLAGQRRVLWQRHALLVLEVPPGRSQEGWIGRDETEHHSQRFVVSRWYFSVMIILCYTRGPLIGFVVSRITLCGARSLADWNRIFLTGAQHWVV